jgi:DNA-binding CsgD family transcriptional regulator
MEDRALLAMTAAGKTQRLIARELRCTEVAVNARVSALAAGAR